MRVRHLEIKGIKLQDFRQFYGENSIEFAQGKKNITVVLGANGNGKTGIFRAVMFALYGDVSLEQDEKLSEVNLVNLNKLAEQEGLPVESKVTLTFSHDGIDYIIERSLLGLQETVGGKPKITTKEGQSKIYMLSDKGDIQELDENPTQKVSEILHKDIREFFFFDAEKMGLLNNTKSKKKLNSEVKEGLMKLLQIKSLDNATGQLNTLINDISKERSRKAKDSNINELETILENEQEKLQGLEQTLSLKVENIAAAAQEIATAEERLGSNNDIREFQLEKERLNQTLTDKKAILAEQKVNGMKLIKEGTPLLIQDFIDRQMPHLIELKDKQGDMIPLDLMERSIANHECQLCSHDIEEESLSHKKIMEMIKQYTFSNATPLINEIQTAQQKMKQNGQVIKGDLQAYIQKIVSTEEEVEKLLVKIQKIDEHIKGKAELLENLKGIEEKLSRHKASLVELNNEKIRLEIEISSSEEKIKTLTKEIQELALKNDALKVDSKVIEKLTLMKELLEKTSTSYTASITDELSMEMTRTFKLLLSEKDKDVFKSVIVSPEYEISVLDGFGNNRVQDLSMGQGQIFTLSFITTLAKLASKGRDEINFPLFMDTPFGRISGENRDNLIKEIPTLTNQWILLLTDTELTRVERDAFDTYNKVSKVYELVNIDGKTTIQEKDAVSDLKVRG